VLSSSNKILVIRGGAIGDFILTLPVLAALRKHFPQTRLEVLGYAHIAQLAVAGGLADAVKSIDSRPLAGFFARGSVLDESLQGYFAGFAVIVSYLYDPDRIFQDNVGRCSQAQFIAGPHRPDEHAGIHATEALLKPLERLAVFESDPVPRLKLQGPNTVNSRKWTSISGTSTLPKDRRWLAVHPGSGSEQKNWPEAKWNELLNRLIKSDKFNILLVGGEAEGDRLIRLCADWPEHRFRVARSLSLPELAERLCQCELFVGHDSGISHLAAAMGRGGLVLWGQSVESVWRPRSERVVVLRDRLGLSHLSVECVVASLSAISANP